MQYQNSKKELDETVNLDKLRSTYKCQNFSSILNKPEEYSLVKNLKTKLFDSKDYYDAEWDLTHLSDKRDEENNEVNDFSNTPISINHNLNNYSILNSTFYGLGLGGYASNNKTNNKSIKNKVSSNNVTSNNKSYLNTEVVSHNKNNISNISSFNDNDINYNFTEGQNEINNINAFDLIKKANKDNNDINFINTQDKDSSNTNRSSETNTAILFDVPLRKNLKKLLQEDYSKYNNEIQANYPRFKRNHYLKNTNIDSNYISSGNTNNNANINIKDITLDESSIETEKEFQLLKKHFLSTNTNSSNNRIITVSNNDLNVINRISTLLNAEPASELEHYYYTSSKVISQIDKGYFTEQDNFKISASQFSLDKDSLQNLTFTLINDSGYIEAEILKILKHSSKIFNYICDNLVIDEIIQNSSFKITTIKEKNLQFKENYIVNTIKKIKFGIKKKNMDKLKSFVSLLGKLKNCKQCLNTLSKSSSKYNIVFDLVNKSREIITKTNELIGGSGNNRMLFCISNFESEFNKYTTKSSDKALDNLINLLKEDYCFTIIDYNIDNSSDIKNINFIEFGKQHKLVDIISEMKDIIKEMTRSDIFPNNNNNEDDLSYIIDSLILPNIKSNEEIENFIIEDTNKVKLSKIKENFNLIFKLDLQFYVKLRQTLRSIIVESFKTVILKLKSNIEICIQKSTEVISSLNLINIKNNIERIFPILITINYLFIMINKFILITRKLEILFIQEVNRFYKNTDNTEKNYSENQLNNIIDTYKDEFKNAEKELIEESMSLLSELTEEIMNVLTDVPSTMVFILCTILINKINYDFVLVFSSNVEIIPFINDFCSKMEEIKMKSSKNFFNKWYNNTYDKVIKSRIENDDFNFSSLLADEYVIKIEHLMNKFSFDDLSTHEYMKKDRLKSIFRGRDFYMKRSNSLASLEEENKETDNKEISIISSSVITSNNSNYNTSFALICLKNKKFKFIQSSLAYLDFLCEIVRLICAFPKHNETLLSLFFKSIKKFSFEKRELVLDAKGTGKNFIKANQSHILALVADTNLIINLSNIFMNSLPSNLTNELTNDIFTEFKVSLDNIVIDSKLALLSLYEEK